MFDRMMTAVVGLGIGALALFLLLNRRTAPACNAYVAITKLTPEIAAETGLSGVYLLNAQSIGGGLLAGTRRCMVYVARVEALQPLARARWLKVIYTTMMDRSTGVVTIQSHVAGPAKPVFTAAPKT